MRGGHKPTRPQFFQYHGSSPHARGTLGQRTQSVNEIRFIPACAGDTAAGGSRRRPRPVHPRMRGGHVSAGALARPLRGSSPHARGTRLGANTGGQQERFIPACAGDTSTSPLTSTLTAVHPRMRGGHAVSTPLRTSAAGSSPHARGTRWVRRQDSHLRRFIPACAGDTSSDIGFRDTASVHPRMRGGHRSMIEEQIDSAGSSPHARGTLRIVLGLARKVRFIPACAGDTTRTTAAGSKRAVHPRMRGGNPRTRRKAERHRGSSPHARGTLRWQNR